MGENVYLLGKGFLRMEKNKFDLINILNICVVRDLVNSQGIINCVSHEKGYN